MKKLTREFAQQQAARLQANPILVPQSKEGRSEFVDCLLRNCATDEHCIAAMTAVLDYQTEYPRDCEGTTARLAYCARLTRTPDTAPPGCDVCFLGDDPGTGAPRWATHVWGERGDGTTYGRRCDCERGQWLAAKQAAEAAKGGKTQPEKRQTGIQPAADWARKLDEHEA